MFGEQGRVFSPQAQARENVCRCDHESNQIETFSCRRTNFAETSTANEGWPGPGSQGYSIPYYEPTQIRTS